MADDTYTSRTVAGIEADLLGDSPNDGRAFFWRGGVQYFAAWDEGATGIFYWPWGCDERTPASAFLGDDEHEAAVALHALLNQPERSVVVGFWRKVLRAVTPGAPDRQEK